jgi:Phage tail sheath C-terminal domain
MATLTSPGLSITVTDESQYVPSGNGTIPLILLATQQDKTSPATGGTAAGTTKANAGKLQSFTSQRELINALGYPVFKQSAGSPLHGDERNEYGLQATYSALGLGAKAYVIRADVDLDQLTATSVRPRGDVTDGFMWLDLANTDFGLYQWSASTQAYTKITPTVLTKASDVNADTLNSPKTTVGQIGSYALVAYNVNNPLFYKGSDNTWYPVGTSDWQKQWPTAQSSKATYVGNEVVGDGSITLTINGRAITITGVGAYATGAEVVTSINSGLGGTSYQNGVKAEIDTNGRLILRATSSSSSTNSTADGKVLISASSGATSLFGTAVGTFYVPQFQFGTYTQVPTYAATDATPAPSGSIWIKTSATGTGANWSVKRYSSTNDSFTKLSAPLYDNKQDAIYGLDLLNGGSGITDGSIFIEYSSLTSYPATFKLIERFGVGATKVTGTVPLSSFVIGNQFTLAVTQPGTGALAATTITLTATTTDGFVSAILAANIPNVYAQKESTGAISIIHRTGGDVVLVAVAGQGTPLTTAGFTISTAGIQAEVSGTYDGSLRATKWKQLGTSYTFSVETPYVSPMDGTYWYYGNSTEADVLICGTDGWKGYRAGGTDARGYTLASCDANGPIFSTTKPTLQSNGSAVARGDLWVDLTDLENYPKLYRYNGTTWTAIDKTDKITQNGIVFADARWDASVDMSGNSIGGIVDPVAGDLPPIATMLTSNYVDLDCPDYRLYPRGTLLWNTRRNGFNVKQYVSNKFNSIAYPNASTSGNNQVGTIPTYAGTWTNASGTQSDGTPYHGHKAQRQMVIKALRSALDSNTDIREDQYQFNLIVCPGYPELITNMVNLNNDRNQTAFVIGDTPLNLLPTSTAITAWSATETTADVYTAVYYPSGLSSDITGAEIVVPPSHMALRTFIHSDNISYQWFAPAGTRRGTVDNATAIGYLDYTSGTFIKTGITQNQRDLLYTQRVNPISLLPNAGLTIFGNKTRSGVAQATDRVNVSRLVNYIRSILTGISNAFLFEPNDKSTRDQIKAAIESSMNDLVAKRGIYDYLVVCDSSNNTSDRIARNELYVDIAIEPMKDVEFIYIPIRLKNPGTIQGGGK